MLYEILAIALAVVVGIVVANAVMFTVMLNGRFMRWFSNKIFKMTMETMKEAEKVFEEELL